MATIKIFNDIFDDKSKDFIYDTSKPLLEQIEEHLDKDYYKSTMVECYDPDTKKTFYAPMEDEDEKEGIILYANGESVTETYIPSENDIVHVVFVPLSGMSNAGWGALIGLGAGVALGLMTGGVGFTALFPALTWTAGNVAFATIAGGALGALIGWTIGDKIDQMQKAGGSINDKKTGEQLPDVRGCSNQSLLGNNFPFVIGKHLVTPFIIGDPYTEYSGERGEDAYIRELLCVGYGPLKLTDFKLGDFMLAYNRSHNNITKDTMIAGLLKGYSTGGVADNGDIVDYWSKNDVELEIIQQPDGAVITSIDPYFQDRTKIDLSQRPLVSSETMNAAGWSVTSGEKNTVYSQKYSNQDNSVTVLMTPINTDGTVLTPSELAEYADDCLNSGDLVSNATVDYNVSYNPAPYNEPYVVNSLSISLNFSIQEITEVQVQINNNWTTVLSLPAGAVTASLSEPARWPGTDCRIKIGDWVSAHFSINGTGSKTVETPEGMTILPHPYNLLATFTGSDSVQQAETYATSLQQNQTDYYFNRNSIGYGSIYTEVTKESVSDANIFFLSDKDLNEQAQVVYKGSSFPNQFRTNTVILSEACPRQFTINLDFPSGLYSTYTQTVNNETQTKYAKIPLWMCIQWRIYDSTKTSSDSKGTDYDDWNTIDFGTNVNKVFSTAEQEEDKARHKGNDFDNLSLDDLYQGFRGKTLQNFQYYSGDNGLSEFRVSATVTLTKEQCKQVMADTNPARIIEIRVLRVSPNYLNQATNDSDTVGPYSYSDHVKVLTTVVKTFDMEALRNDDELKPVRVLSEKDLKKLCLVAIKAKADKAGYLQNNMESITCTAESFSPIWDSESKKILPERTSNGTTEKITKVRKYYGYFEGNTNIKANRTDAAYERELTGPNAKEQYEEARHEGKDWYMEKAGSNFPALIKNEVYDDPVLHNDTLCWYLPQSAEKFNNNSASSGALLALFGEQSGPEAIGLEDLNIVAFSDWAEKSAAVNDGTTAPMAMDYNGHHYNKGDLIPVRYEANAYIYQGTKIEDLLQKLAFCGRAAWVIDEAGQVKFIMDAPVDYTKGAINAQNCISSSNAFNYEEPPAGLFITFHDENDGYENNSFYVWTDGNSASRYHGSVEQMSMDYITNNVQVTSLARYTLASRVQNKEILTRKVGPNGIIYSLGDVVLVQSDELLIGDVSGRIQEVIENNGTIYGFVMDSDYEYTAELDSNNVNSNQGVTIIQPSYMGKSNAVTLPLSSPRTQSVPLDYEQVYPVGTENPQAEGWYVKNGDQYILTTDTTVNDEHTYYQVIMVSYTLQKGLTNIVLFGKVIGDQYGIPRDTSEDYSAKTDVKYNFKTGDVAMMGLIEKISAPYRISKIKPEAGGKFTETLIPYDESFYNYGKALPTFQSYITPPQVIADSVPLSEVPTTLKEQNDALQTVYNAIGVPYDPVPPALPSSISIIASRDYISLAWANTSPNVKHTIIELSKQNGDDGTWTQVAIIDSDNWRYNFNRNTDGYPEADTGTNKLSTWRFRFKNVSICDVESAFTTAQSVTYTNYGTWKPAQPSFASKIPSEGGITFNWNAATPSDGRQQLYGTQKYTVTVKYEDTDHSVAETVMATLKSNTLTVNYPFNRSRDGYPEVIASANYKGLNKYTFQIKVENESGEHNESNFVTFSSSETDEYGTWIPSAINVYTSFSNYADEYGVNVRWEPVGGYNGKTLYGSVLYEVSRQYEDSGTRYERGNFVTDTTSYVFLWKRSGLNSDGYPEKSTTPGVPVTTQIVNQNVITITPKNAVCEREGSPIESYVSEAEYLTWIPHSLSGLYYPKWNVSKRCATISFVAQNDVYGKLKYGFLISRVATDNNQFYTPDLETDCYSDIDSYKLATSTALEVDGMFKQNLPLLGQDMMSVQVDRYDVDTRGGTTDPEHKAIAREYYICDQDGEDAFNLKYGDEIDWDNITTTAQTYSWVLAGGTQTDYTTRYVTVKKIDSPLPDATEYKYRIYVRNADSGAKSSDNDILVTPDANSVSDLVDKAITVNKLDDQCVTTEKIATGAITAEQIAVTNLLAKGATAGTMKAEGIMADGSGFWVGDNKTMRYDYKNPDTGTDETYLAQSGEFFVGNNPNHESDPTPKDEFIHFKPASGTNPSQFWIAIKNIIFQTLQTIVTGIFRVKNSKSDTDANAFLTVNPTTSADSGTPAQTMKVNGSIKGNAIYGTKLQIVKNDRNNLFTEDSPVDTENFYLTMSKMDDGTGRQFFTVNPTTNRVGYAPENSVWTENGFVVGDPYTAHTFARMTRGGLNLTKASVMARLSYSTVTENNVANSVLTFDADNSSASSKIVTDVFEANESIYANSVYSGNVPYFGTVYSAGTYNSGYFLLAQLEGAASSGTHDVAMAGRVLKDSAGTIQISDFYIYARGNNATISTALFIHTGVKSKAPLVATYEVFSTNRYRIRLYGLINNNWQKFNTVIHYASGGDVSTRVSNLNVTFPNTQSSAVTGTTIGETTTLAGNAETATNASQLNGYASASTNTANTVVRRDSNGYIYGTYYNASCGLENINSYINNSPNIVFSSSDNWFRKTNAKNISVGRAGYSYDVRETGDTGYWKIKINNTSHWMLCFVVTLYQGYVATKIMISGYNYNYNATYQWHEPRATLLGSSNGETQVTVYFGYDARRELWVGFRGNLYGSVAVTDIVNGYDQITDWSNAFSITKQSPLSGTTQTTYTATLSVNYASASGTATTANKIRTSNSNPSDGDIWIQ